jgi:DNA replication licensing factor MCM4
VCCIDEFDKMSDATRSVLHEVMEQQTISIAKAGIITTLNARTSVLASANPINSRYDPNLPVTSNIDLPPPLLSRFDLVYLILDKVDEKIDRQLARHLTDMYLEDAPDTVNNSYVLPVDFLTSYIQYAKENYEPVLTETAKQELVKSYVEMRKLGDDSRASERRVTATTRQLESMIRLSEAHAKMRLSETVDLIDVKEAVRLIKSAIKDYATDPITGRIDMDMVQTGTTAAQRRMQDDLATQVMNIIEAHNNSIRFNDLIHSVNELSSIRVENNDLIEAIKRLQYEGKLIETGESHRRTIKKVAGIV